ncbi:MAG: hypothetical protein ACKOEX_05830 [Planctomycetia bacterium]
MEFHGFSTGLVIILGGVLTSITLVTLARKLFSKDVLREAHDITGNLLSVVGTLYAVLLGLIVVDALVRFEHAVDVVQDESNSLANLFLLSEKLPPPYRERLEDLCKAYAHQVVEKEWPLMQRGLVSVDARKTAFSLTRALTGFEPSTESEKAVYPMILEQTRELWNFRRERTCTAEYGIPAVEWFVLIIGGAVTVIFGGLFCARSVSLQRFLTTLAALLIGLNLYLVSLFGYPFAGELTVSSRPFKVDIAIFDGRFENMPAHEREHAGE